ncbi:helix-turn-helix domain-containing protein [Cryobacterium sp. TMT1-21]|uniref:excisionase family DNA-binding protein n=1 Tax=Cryobacterium sp. TMT1-21 TaxID=1259234 RepID=UPI00106BEC9F|nr:excisionase family DNA-binding protein [Cryobacterium sp. TMT1-21]TFD11523.1 helix-turn-helix domain-containing protein [Cryobacterium sp. TMT1-21]
MAGTALLTGSQIVDEVVQLEASHLVSEAHDRQVGSVTMTLDDGTEVLLQKNLARFIVNLVESIAADGTLTTTSLPEELSTTVAAQVIGVSRPTLMKMIARKELPTKKVGSHTRLMRSDVLELRAHRQGARVKAVEDLRRAGDAFD